VTDPYHFTQKERDAESGLHYFEARYLAANAGRFISVDPLYAEPLQMGGEKVSQLLSDPQGFNLYSYARNNPLAYTDPSGYDPIAAGDSLPYASVLSRTTVLPYKSVLPSRRTDIVAHGAWVTKDEVQSNEKGGYDMTWDVIKKGSKAGYFVVPDGTTITAYAPHGFAITEELGRAIQLGGMRPEQFQVTYHPGDVIPDYLLLPPKGLRAFHLSGVNTVTVDEPTSLSSVIKPGMGAVNLAMCLEDVNPPWHNMTGTWGLLQPGDDPDGGGWCGYPARH